MSPTGKAFEILALEIFRLAGAKIAEHWAVVDYTTMFQQLGAT
jgi:predicted ester cyclase